MENRIRFTKTVVMDLPLPEKGRRGIYYDTEIPKLAVRITASGTRAFYVVKRDGRAMAWFKLGSFPDVTVEAARKSALRALGDFAKGISPAAAKREERQKQTLGEAFDQYCTMHLAPHDKKTATEIRAMWERCLGTLPDLPAKKHGRKRTKHPAGVDWSKKKLDSIDNAAVRALHAGIGKTHRTLANRVIEMVSSIFNRATEWGYRGANPADGIRPFKEVKRDRFIQSDELPRFFEALAADTSVDFKHFVLLALLTGARRTNVLSMRWQDVSLQSATWRIPDTKNDEPQIVALVPEAVEVLREREPKETGYVFPAPSATGFMTPPKKRWRALLARAGVKDLRIHDLRRSLGSWQAISGASLAIIGKSLGHKSADATMIYARLSLDPVRASLNTATSAMLEAAGVKKSAVAVPLEPGRKRKAAAA